MGYSSSQTGAPDLALPAHAGDLVADRGGLGRYVVALPNLIDDLGLSVFAVRLYLHYKTIAAQAAGAGGAVAVSLRRLADGCRMSTGRAWAARAELRAAGVIAITAQGGKLPDRVDLLDLWPRNFARYARSAPEAPGDLQKWRIELPALVDRLDLSPYAVRLYLRYVRAAGGPRGHCSQSARTLARACDMSPGQVSKCRAILAAPVPGLGLPLIDIRRRDGSKQTDLIVPANIWAAAIAGPDFADVAGAEACDHDADPAQSGAAMRSYSDRKRSYSDHGPEERSYSDRKRSYSDRKNIRIRGVGGNDPDLGSVSGGPLPAQAAGLLRALGVSVADKLAQGCDPRVVYLHACQYVLDRRDDPDLSLGVLVHRIQHTPAPALSRFALRLSRHLLAGDGFGDLAAAAEAAAEADDRIMGQTPAPPSMPSPDLAGLQPGPSMGPDPAPWVTATRATWSDPARLWAAVCADLAGHLSTLDQRFIAILDGATLAEDGAGYVVRLPDTAGADWIQNRLASHMQFSISSLLGRRVDLRVSTADRV